MNSFFSKSIILFSISLFCLSLSSCTTGQFHLNGDQDKNAPLAPPAEVAILMPINGENPKLYKELSLMTKLGLSDSAKSKIRVTTYDCSNRESLNIAINHILGKSELNFVSSDGQKTRKSDLVIGPIFSNTASEVNGALKGKRIPILTLSNNPVLAREDVFVLGHAPMRQMESLVSSLLSDGFSNYVIVLPAGRYSQSVTSVLENIITSRDGVVSRVIYYGESEEELASSVKLASDTVDNLNELDTNLKKPVILISDNENQLKKIFAYMKDYKLDQKAMIAGDSKINIADNKLNVLYTASSYERTQIIRKKAAELGIHHIGFLHDIAYDAGYIAGLSIEGPYDYDNFIKNIRLLNKSSNPESKTYRGLSGTISFTDSIALRTYDIVKTTNTRNLE